MVIKIHFPIGEKTVVSCINHEMYLRDCEDCKAALKACNSESWDAQMRGYRSGISSMQNQIDHLRRMLAISSLRKDAWRDAALAAGVCAEQVEPTKITHGLEFCPACGGEPHVQCAPPPELTDEIINERAIKLYGEFYGPIYAEGCKWIRSVYLPLPFHARSRRRIKRERFLGK